MLKKIILITFVVFGLISCDNSQEIKEEATDKVVEKGLGSSGTTFSGKVDGGFSN